MLNHYLIVENPALKLSIHSSNHHQPSISRRTIVRCIKEELTAAVPRIKDMIQNLTKNIGITCDGWFPSVLKGYFAITAY